MSLTEDLNTEHEIGLLLNKELDEAILVVVRLCTAVCREGELADFVGDALSLELLLVLADPSHLGVGVNDRGNDGVVDVAVPSGENLGGSDT